MKTLQMVMQWCWRKGLSINTRSITLLNLSLNVITRMINTRLHALVHKTVSFEQMGLRANVGTRVALSSKYLSKIHKRSSKHAKRIKHAFLEVWQRFKQLNKTLDGICGPAHINPGIAIDIRNNNYEHQDSTRRDINAVTENRNTQM